MAHDEGNQERLNNANDGNSPTPRLSWRAMNFAPEFFHCKEHGRFQLTFIDEEGNFRSRSPECPVCRKFSETKKLMEGAQIPPRFIACTFENYHVECDEQKKALDKCMHYANEFASYHSRGEGLILIGNPGTGKNHLSTAISRTVMDAGFSVLRIKSSEYVEAYWSKDFGERAGWINSLAKIDLLIIDEIGKSSETKSANNAFFRLLDARYEEVRPSMLISNLNDADMRRAVGTEAWDRMKGGKIVGFDWGSYRGRRG